MNRIQKTPAINKPILVYKKDVKLHKQHENNLLESRLEVMERRLNQSKPERVWNETKIYYLPLMPTELDEKDAYIEKEYRCSYCEELCDDETLECKVCSKVYHIICLFKRGHLSGLNVPKKIEWSCSECSDLSRCLNDDEIRKIINIYDELDFKRNCYVTFEDYMKIKKKLYEQDGDEMSQEREEEEKKRFKLMDKDRSGSITWTEFVEFESANLLAKKNKIELSNFLSNKELIYAKKLFLAYDKDNQEMIDRQDAKKIFYDLIQKLNIKLGPSFAEHISSCSDLFGLNSNQEKKNSAKTIWPEFIRKITILLLYDRLNSYHFRPKYWKPGIWHSIYDKENSKPDKELTILPSINKPSDPNEALKRPMNKPITQDDFGSFEYVIRSKNFSRLSSNSGWDEDENEEEDSAFFDTKKKHYNKHNFKHNTDIFNSSSITNSYGAFSYKTSNSKSFNNFDYNKVTKDIYKNFGKNYQNSLQASMNSFHLPSLVDLEYQNKAKKNLSSLAENKYLKLNEKSFQSSNSIDSKFQNNLNIVNKVLNKSENNIKI